MSDIYQKIEGLMKITVILIIFIYITVKVFIKYGGKTVINNWSKQQSNPAIMPLAGIFGKNTSKNTTGVLYGHFKTNFSFFMKPFHYITSLISTILGKLINSMNLFRTILKPIRQFFMSAAQTFYDKIQNFTNMTVFFLAKIRDILNRMSSTFRLTLYSLQAIQMSVKSIWDGPIGEVSRDWAYAFDTISGFFCLTGNTLIKTDKNKSIPVSKLKPGMDIYTPEGKTKVMGITISKNLESVLYQVKDVILSGSHLVNYNNRWIRARDIGKSITNFDEPYLYCPITQNNLLYTNSGLLLKDFDELYSKVVENKILNVVLNNLNNTDNYSIEYPLEVLNGCLGVSGETKIALLDNNSILAKNVKIGDNLNGGNVLGIIIRSEFDTNVSLLNDHDMILNRQILFKNNKWQTVFDLGLPSYHLKTSKLFYSFMTTEGYYIADNLILADSKDKMNSEQLKLIDNIVLNHINLC